MKKFTLSMLFMSVLGISVAGHALPLSVRIDMLKTQMVEQLKAEQYAEAVQTMQELKATGAELPDSFEYFEGKALFESGQQAASYDKFAHYVESQGTQAEYYKETIAYLIEAEKALPWKHLFGDNGDDSAFDMIKTADGGFVIAGYTSSEERPADGWVIRLDAQGQRLWDRSFGGSKTDVITAIVQTADGGFALAGHTWSKGEGASDVWVVRLDAQGQHLWDYTFGGSNEDEGYGIVQTADGGFAVVAQTASNKEGRFGRLYGWVIRLDAQGQRLWDRTFGGINHDRLYGISQTTDGDFVVVGQRGDSKDGAYSPGWVIRLDAQGQTIWERTFEGNGGSAWLNDIIQTADGGFVAVGGSTFSGQQWDAWVIRLDAQGQKLWERHFGDSKVKDDVYSVTQTADGGFAVVAQTASNKEGRFGLYGWVIRLDDQGQRLWQRSFGDGKKSVRAWAIVQTDDGGFAVAGQAPSQRYDNQDVWFLQLNSMGEPK